MPLTSYLADDARLYQIKMSAEKIAVAGTVPTGTISTETRVYASKPKGRYGIGARFVTATTPNGATIGSTVAFEHFPVLDPAQYNGTAFQKGQTIMYKGKTYTIVGRTSERAK